MLLLNRYEYSPQVDLIGKSSFARVYKALDKKMNRKVGLKIYKITQLTEEFGITGDVHKDHELDHPNIIRYYDTEEIEREDAFGEKELLKVRIMEYFEEGNLASYYAKNPDPEILNKLLRDTLKGISYLNRNGVIHGNLKPTNILVKNTYEGPIAKISDMGLSQTYNKSYNSSSSGFVVSPLYMAPEQLNSGLFGKDAEIGTNIDLWGFGVSVYEVLTGESLFLENPDDSPEQIIANIISFNAMEKLEKLPPFYRNFLSPCLIRDAGLRLKNIDELIMLLETPYLKVDATNNEIQFEKKIAPVEEEIKTNNELDENTVLSTSQNESTLPDTASTSIQTLDQISEDENPKIISYEDVQKIDATEIIADKTGDLAPFIEDQLEETSTIKITEEISQVSKPASEDIHDINETILFIKPTAFTEQEKVANLSDSLPDSEDTVVLRINEEKNKAPESREESMPSKRPDNIRLFNRYEYHPAYDLIGKGGFSRVYRAYDKKLDRWVALKIYKGNEMLERYSPVAEIRRVINLDHPNICRYLDIEDIEKYNALGELEKIQVCVMELLDGGNLSEYYNKIKNITVLKKLVNDILNGIAFLHRKNIIHRDIKPANILIKETNEGPVAKITDFGISKGMDSVNTSSTSALIVSIPFMAPEQINAKKYGIEGTISSNLDLWTFGVSLYEVITGKVLFKENDQDTSEQIMSNIMAPELPDRITDLPSPFREIVEKCLIKDARLRAQRAEELIAILNTELKPVNTAIPSVIIPADESGIKIPDLQEKPVQNEPPLAMQKEKSQQTKKEEVIPKLKDDPKRIIKEDALPKPLPTRKTSIFMDDAEPEKSFPVKKKETKPIIQYHKKIPVLPISLGLLFVASLITIFYLFTRDHNVKKDVQPIQSIVTSNTQPTDTNVKTSSVENIEKSPEIKAQNIKELKKGTTKPNNPQPLIDSNEPGIEARTKKPTNEASKNESSAIITIKSANSFSLKIISNRDCKIELNNEDWGIVYNGRPKRFKIDPGTYNFVAFDLKTRAIIKSETFDLKEGQMRSIRID